MIEVHNISKGFGDNQVLNNISFEFEKGKTNLIIGARSRISSIGILVNILRGKMMLFSTDMLSNSALP